MFFVVNAIFAFGMSGFSMNNNIKQVDFDALQHNVYAAYINAGASSDEAWTESINAFNRCEANNNPSLTPR